MGSSVGGLGIYRGTGDSRVWRDSRQPHTAWGSGLMFVVVGFRL